MENTRKTLTPEEKWESLTLANNFIFCKVMESNPELCKHLLEMLLHIKIDRLETPQSERTMQESIDSKGVRFDVYTKDNDRIFDIEIQCVNKKNLPKRARYFQSIIDVSNMSVGVDYRYLKDTYIIFLCINDLFEKNLPVYTFENICREDRNLELKDGAYKYFFIAKNCDKMSSEAERTFFNFLTGGEADDDFTQNLQEKVAFAKRNLEWKNMYMTIKEAFCDEIDEAREEAAQAKAIESARNLLRMNLLTSEQISQAVSLPLEQVLTLKEELAAEVSCEKLRR